MTNVCAKKVVDELALEQTSTSEVAVNLQRLTCKDAQNILNKLTRVSELKP